MKLKTIEEHNKEILDRHERPNHTGVECPNCKNELQQVGRGIMMSNPPQVSVMCFECGYTSSIYVQ